MAETVETAPADQRLLAVALQELGLEQLPAHVMVFEIDGPVFFGAVENFKRTLLDAHAAPRVLILRLDQVPFIDMTGIEMLEDVMGALGRRGTRTILCEANPRVLGKLNAAGVLLDGVAKPEAEATHVATLSAAIREAMRLPT